MAPVFSFDLGDTVPSCARAPSVSLSGDCAIPVDSHDDDVVPPIKAVDSKQTESQTYTKLVHGFGGGRRRASISAVANAEGASVSSLVAAVEATKIAYGQAHDGKPVGGLAKLFAYSEVSSRAVSEAGDISSERSGGDVVSSGTKKKKKKRSRGGKKGKGGKNDVDKWKTLQVPESFRDTAAKTAGDSDGPDWTFAKRSTPPSSSSSRSSSPPRHSALSSLLSQAHPGDQVSITTGDDSSSEGEPGEPLVAYEVALDEDYIAQDDQSRPLTRAGDGDYMRKMCADDFEPLRCLGKGTYGTVLLVRHKSTGKLYAQKQLKKASLVVHKKMIEQTKTERAILESVRHPFVVKLYYAFQDREKLYLILEYAQGGELFLHLATSNYFSEDTASFYLAQLVLALSHLHQNVGVVYRDLKPENCLLDAEGHLLLTDFGLSKVKTDGAKCSSFLGTPEYMAPEVLSGDGEREYGAEVDWWALGALAFDLMTGGPPFTGNNHQTISQKIIKKKLSIPYYLSADAKDLITRLLRKEPSKRLGYCMPSDLQKIKKHRFFRKIDWEKLEKRELVPPIIPLVTDPALAENFEKGFTELRLSPPVGAGGGVWFSKGAAAAAAAAGRREEEEGLFGGFSFVASESVLNSYLGGDW